jgi:hypothetical protein
MEGGGWWWAHNEVIDTYGARLGPTAVAVYCYLCVRANEAQLVELKLVAHQKRARRDGGQTSNLYTLLTVPEGVPEEKTVARMADLDFSLPYEVLDERIGPPD